MTREEALVVVTNTMIEKYKIDSFDAYSYWMMDQDVYYEILETISNDGYLTEEEVTNLEFGEMPAWVTSVWDGFETTKYGNTCG